MKIAPSTRANLSPPIYLPFKSNSALSNDAHRPCSPHPSLPSLLDVSSFVNVPLKKWTQVVDIIRYLDSWVLQRLASLAFTLWAFAVLHCIRLSSQSINAPDFFFFFIKAACLLNNPSLTIAYLLDLVWAFIILLYFTFSGFLGIFKSISGFWNVLIGVW